MTRAGGMDRQISVYKKETTPDATYGTPVVTWVPLVAAPGSPVIAERWWAEVQDVMPSRSESVRQGLALARNQTRLRLRYRDDIDSTMKVVVHGDADVEYQIVGGPAEIEGRKRRIEIVLEKYSTA